MRVAHVDSERGWSGGEVQVLLLLEGLRERGHAAVVVAPPASELARRAAKLGFDVREVAMRNSLDVPAVLALARVLRSERCELAHLHTGRATWLGALAAARAEVPALSTRRQDKRISLGPKARLVYGRLCARTAAISPAILLQLLESGVPRERLRLVPSTVACPDESAPGAAAATRAKLEEPADAPVVLAAAALVRRKGLDVLLAAWPAVRASIPGARLWIAGDGEERTTLERQATELGIAYDVRFLGRRDDVDALLVACDVFVLPSRAEGLGVAALEAMARARPVVATRVGGLADLVLDGTTGLLVAPEDPVALAESVARLLGDGKLRARLGAAGRERVRSEHSVERMVSSYERLYTELLDERR